MEKEIKAVVEKFEGFIKRSVLPSASFMLFFLLYDVLLNQQAVIKFLDQKDHSQLTIGLLILAFIGLTNLLSILQQGIYDNRLKDKFNGSFLFKNENDNLDDLRKDVNEKLNKDENDYMLYKIIGKDMKTENYVNQSKSFGIMFISLCAVGLISFITSLIQLNEEITISSVSTSFFTLLFISISWYIGRELVKGRYRSRAIKIYTNYLEQNSTSAEANPTGI